MKVSLVENKLEKENISSYILNDLNLWFEDEDAVKNYIEKSKEYIFFKASENGKNFGFIVYKETSDYTIEIFVMGVLKNYHRKNIGRYLFEKSIEILKTYNYEFIQVKTLKEGIDDGYDKTNKFYQALGFRKFEVIEEIWSEDNPCQIYVKSIVWGSNYIIFILKNDNL